MLAVEAVPLSTAVFMTFPELSPLRSTASQPQAIGHWDAASPVMPYCVWSSLCYGNLGNV